MDHLSLHEADGRQTTYLGIGAGSSTGEGLSHRGAAAGIVVGAVMAVVAAAAVLWLFARRRGQQKRRAADAVSAPLTVGPTGGNGELQNPCALPMCDHV